MVQKIGRGGNERGGEGKEEKEEEEEKEEDEEEDEEDEEEDKEDEEDEEEEEDESVENLVRGDSFKAKAKAKPKQSKIHKTRRQAGGFVRTEPLQARCVRERAHCFACLHCWACWLQCTEPLSLLGWQVWTLCEVTATRTVTGILEKSWKQYV